jgi:hypothetical protein
MLFDDKQIFGRRLAGRKTRKRKRKPILNVKAKSRSRKNVDFRKMSVFGVIPLAAVAIVALVWFGFGMFFSHSPAFKVREIIIDIPAGSEITGERVKEFSRIEEGMNLFDVDLQRIRKEFIQDLANIRTVEVSRHLPDTIKIRIVERDPLARIGRRGSFVADADGRVFVRRAGISKLPVIIGPAGEKYGPGANVKGMTFAALQVLDVCRDSQFDIPIDAIDSGYSEYLLLRIGRRTDKLSWADMTETTPESKESLVGKIEALALVLENDTGKTMMKLDSTYDGRIYGEM